MRVIVFLVGTDFSSRHSKIIIKIGTAAIYDLDNNLIRHNVFESLAKDISELMKRGHEVILVSSGAVGFGKGFLGRDFSKQTHASIGQNFLMQEYSGVFLKYGLYVSQFLLSKGDLDNKYKMKSIMNTSKFLRCKAIIIINENDALSTKNSSFGDNDLLSSELLLKLDFDCLILLTEKGALVKENNSLIKSNLFSERDYDSLNISSGGSGGLQTKLNCAKKVIDADKKCFIGRAGDSLQDILNSRVIATELTHNNFKYAKG